MSMDYNMSQVRKRPVPVVSKTKAPYAGRKAAITPLAKQYSARAHRQSAKAV